MAPQEKDNTKEGTKSRLPEGVAPPRVITPYKGEIVIAGLSGRYPESANVKEFRDNLFSGTSMVTIDNRRWEPGYKNTPLVMSKLKDISRFDHEFFRINNKEADVMDPSIRILLEVAYEAVIDAGESIDSMKGTRTGVYIANNISEAEAAWMGKDLEAYVVPGVTHCMLANRISYFFDLRAPSCVYDTACSSSVVCMEAADTHLRTGVIDRAIVAACNILYRPATTEKFVGMKFLSQTSCKTFDVNADGFVRAEVVSAVLLKKAGEAKRSYGTLLGTMTNNDGFNPNGLLFPNIESQEELMRDLYMNFNIDPNEIKYFECHGTGTQAGDPQETNSVCNFMCANRKEPLYIGSTKSNMGHGEASSGFAALSKIIIGMHEGKIPANLHFETPNPAIPGLFNGKLKVVTEHLPWNGGCIAHNSFGMGGTNAHMVIRSYDKKATKPHPASQLPRLFVYSARTEEGLRGIFNEAHTHADNVEFHALCQESANTSTKNMPYRGATLLNAKQEFSIVEKCPSKPREIWFIYPGMGSQWVGMGRGLMALDVFRSAIEECTKYLKPFGIDLMKIIMEGSEDSLKTITNPFICICAIQLGLTDLLKTMDIVPDGIVGHSLGEVGCGYADGCLTKKEAIMSAYWRGQCMIEGKVAPGKMAAVGLTWEEAKSLAPSGVVAACHNGADSVTISGDAKPMAQFMADLEAKGIFVKEVNSNNIAYHSHSMKSIGPRLKAALEKEITPKPRSQKWISTSIPEDRWGEPLAQDAGAAYHANNLESPVLFYEGLQKIPSNAIAIEIAPMGLLQSVIKKSLGQDVCSVSLQKRKYDENLEFFFQSIAKCFANGAPMNPLKLYPYVEFPVSQGTPMLSSMISEAWDHSVQWRVPHPEDFEQTIGSSSDTTFDIDATEDSPDHYLMDHQVDGRPLFPACGCLFLAWKTLAQLKGLDYEEMPVKLTNVQIHQALFLSSTGAATVSVSVVPRTGEFHVCEGERLLASGTIVAPEEHVLEIDQYCKKNSVLEDKIVSQVLTRDEVYREFICKGYEYGPYFQGIQRASLDGLDTDHSWDGRWISYMDSVLQLVIINEQDQVLPIKLQSVNIDPTLHPPAPADGEESKVIPGIFDPVLGIAAAGGVEIRGVVTIISPRRLTHDPPNVEEYTYVPNCDVNCHERTAPAVTPELRAYADAMFEMSQQVDTRWLAEGKAGLLPNKDRLQEALDLGKKIDSAAAKATLETLLSSNNGHGLRNVGIFEILKMAMEEPMDDDFLDRVRTNFHEMRLGLWDDALITALETPDILKLIFETVAENVSTQVMDVVEIAAGQTAFYRQAFPKALDHFSVKDVRYTLGSNSTVEDAVSFDVKTVTLDPMDPSSIPSSQYSSADLLILKWNLHAQKDLDEAMEAYSKMIKPGGFILVEELVDRLPLLFTVKSTISPDMGGKAAAEGERILGCFYNDSQWRAFFSRHGFEEIIHRHDGLMSSVFLLRKRHEPVTLPVIVYMDDLECTWLEEVKAKYAEIQDAPEDARLWLVAKNEFSGIMGFYTCLKWEQGSDKIRCIHISNHQVGSSMPRITLDSAEFNELVKRDLSYNIYRDGRWGTYRGLSNPEEVRLQERPKQHVFADCLTMGDVASMRWFDSPLNLDYYNDKVPTSVAVKNAPQEENALCAVYYAGVDTRDALLANGTLKKNILPERMASKEGIFGLEFAGRDATGRRVMGLCAPPALATSVLCPRSSLWSVPEAWSLEEAATVPLAYATAYYALLVRGHLKHGEKVLIHEGGSAVGQAAIAVALSNGCEVFTLTKNKEEKTALKANFPNLKERNLCTYENLSFEKHVLVETKGKGVDIVLSTMSGNILQASIRTLSKRGRFMNLSFTSDDNDSTSVGRNLQFQMDDLIDSQGPEWTEVYELVQAGIMSGEVKPLGRTMYAMDKVVDACKAVSEKRHSGKVLVQMRGEEQQRISSTTKTTFPSVFRTSFDPSKSYVLLGGLGGMGLEFAKWMVQRGARKILLTSRSGITTGYQTRKLSYLRSQGAEVEVASINVNTKESANILIKLASIMGPVGGLFNLATALHDDSLMNQTHDNFIKVLEAKITTTLLLDDISRQQPVRDSLDHFVMFSSVVSSHGHIGQTNYAFGNSAMERICERRRLDGLPAFVVQWASIADVGIVAAKGNNVIICGKFPQRLYNVLHTFDYMLSQDKLILLSYVIAEKSSAVTEGEESRAIQAAKAVGKVLGIKDVTAVDGDKEFLELGMDSLMGVEVKQMLERDLDIIVSTKDVQIMTFKSLATLVEG